MRNDNLIKIGDEFSWDTIGGKRYEGEVVEFESEKTDRGPAATNIRRA